MNKIPKSGINFDEKKNKLVNDILISRELNHPGILKIHEIYQDADNFYVVSEFF